MSRTLAYIRVSSDKQDIVKDRALVEEYASREHLPFPIIFYEDDGVSTNIPWKERKISFLLDNLVKGDILVTTEISRLARDMFQVMEIAKICISKGCVCHIMSPALKIDDSATSQMLSMVFGYVAQMEKELLRQRTRDALRIRKEKGLPIGRPKGTGSSKLDMHRPTIEAWLKEGRKPAQIARSFKTSGSNFHHWLKQNNLWVGRPEKNVTVTIAGSSAQPQKVKL